MLLSLLSILVCIKVNHYRKKLQIYELNNITDKYLYAIMFYFKALIKKVQVFI